MQGTRIIIHISQSTQQINSGEKMQNIISKISNSFRCNYIFVKTSNQNQPMITTIRKIWTRETQDENENEKTQLEVIDLLNYNYIEDQQIVYHFSRLIFQLILNKTFSLYID